MILTLLSIDSPKNSISFDAFEKLTTQRYSSYLAQQLKPFGNHTLYSAVRPYHSGVLPFLAMDMMIQFRAMPCRFFFGHDLLTFGSTDAEEIHKDEHLREEVDRILGEFPPGVAAMTFRGFGNRIDLGLNGLGRLYVDILGSLTRVESEVLSHLRELRFEKYGDPTMTRTFGLQKKVAQRLGKSPVAIHKSMRSAKYSLLADTAMAMKGMMV